MVLTLDEALQQGGKARGAGTPEQGSYCNYTGQKNNK